MLGKLSEHDFGGYLLPWAKHIHMAVRMESSHRPGCSWEVVGFVVLLPWHMAENGSQAAAAGHQGKSPR